jgi:hypothetical protein
MKKIMILTTVLMLVFSSLTFAGGDQNCGSDGEGDTGVSAPGDATQNRAPGD